MPMQLNPIADTSSPWLPSLRLFIVMIALFQICVAQVTKLCRTLESDISEDTTDDCKKFSTLERFGDEMISSQSS
jgi:hypothetical protein